MKIITLILLSLFSFQSLAQAGDDIQYVTGKLYLSLYEQADSGSTVIKSLVSGDRLDVLEIAGPYAMVVTDKNKEGWVKKGFLVKDKPAAILYKEADKALKSLQEQVALDKEKNSSIDEIMAQLEVVRKENNELKQIKEIFLRQQELKTPDNSDNKDSAINSINKIDLDLFIAFIKEYSLYLIASLILVVLIGFRLGEIKTESEVIKHFGGVKVW